MRTRVTALLGGLVGAAAFLLAIGPQVVRPTNLGWTMRPDLQTYVLAWTHFRTEPWHWPIAEIRGVGYPIGTSIGNTDAIPIVAFLLKPFDAVLPEPAQYLGAWLLLCFVLQGVLGVLLMRLATPDRWLHLLGAALFVQTPALFNRLGHPALCAHWLLLAALWLVLEGRRAPRRWHGAAWMAVTALAAAIQPYLALMVMTLAGADILNRAWARVSHDARSRSSVAGAVALETCGVVASALLVFWVCGYFLVGSVGALQSGGLGEFSMNLLGPVTGMGYSTLLPGIPLGRPGQYEGHVYFGAGWLLLCVVALVVARRSSRPLPGLGAGWVSLVACTLIAISPVVTFGAATLVDLSASAPSALAIVRSSGRFGWVPMYAAFALAALTVASQLPRRVAIALLTTATLLQAIDMSGAYRALHERMTSPEWTEYTSPLRDPAWERLVPLFKHVALTPPRMCSSVWAPIAGDDLPFSLVAGRHRVTINSGDAGRYDIRAILDYCRQFEADVRAGTLAPDTLYVLSPAMRAAVRTQGEPLVCGNLDGFDLCATGAPLRQLRAAAPAAGFEMARAW